MAFSFLISSSKRKQAKDETNDKQGGDQKGGLIGRFLGLKGPAKQETRHTIKFDSLGDRILSYKALARQATAQDSSPSASSEPPKPPPSSSSASSTVAAAPTKPVVYVLTFKGDIQASQVKDLREEITAILESADASKGDEVVLLLTSGGGTISGYGHATAQLLRLVSAGLKLSVCVDEVAASGGYMMAAVANEIIASPFAIIGSIGVVSTMPNVTKLLDSLGVEVEDVTAGQYKRTMVPYKLSTPESRQKVQEDVDIYHAAFQEHILKCRGEKGIDVVKVATGETWFGDTALKLKLVDRIGTSDELLLSRLKAGKDVLLVRHRLERRSLFGEWAPVEAGEHAEGSLLLGADAQSLVDSAVLSLAKALTKLSAPSASAKN